MQAPIPQPTSQQPAQQPHQRLLQTVDKSPAARQAVQTALKAMQGKSNPNG